MMKILNDLLSDVHFEKPIAYGRLRLTPLRLGTGSDLEYRTLDDAETLVTVEETAGAGTVPELVVRNKTNQRVLILEGTTLIGAKQNRVVNLTILLAPESVTVIPVSCVERGRWRYVSAHFRPSWHADGAMRKMMCKGTTTSLKRSGKVQVDQGAVWDHVGGMLYESAAASPTDSYHAMYEKWEREFAEYEANLKVSDEVSGVAVEVDGILQSIDLFDKATTLRQVWPKLAKCYIASALRPNPAEGEPIEVKKFLQRALTSPVDSFAPVGIGTTVRVATEEADGGALLCDGRLVHLSLFANPLPKKGSEALKTQEPTGDDSPDTGSGPQPTGGRPWWRVWR